MNEAGRGSWRELRTPVSNGGVFYSTMVAMPDIISSLNEAQQEAVTTTKGPVLILAGAGSGKTRTLTARIAYLMAEQHVPPTAILAVTFTNKAAGELAERVRQWLRDLKIPTDLPWLGTFHSICVKILRRELNNSSLPLSASFSIYDSADQQALVRAIMHDLSLDTKQYNPKGVLAFISSAKSELLTPEAYAGVAAGQYQTMVAKVYREYQMRLVAANAMDFDDLLMRALQLLRQHPEIATRYQHQFEYILVDEYQDTNKAQYELVRLLSAIHRNIMVVGDDWQAIYAFRGADFRNILRFESDFTDATIIKLEKNYRSTQTILDAAHAIIKRNQVRSDKKLTATREEGEKIGVVACLNDIAEGEFVINESRRLIREKAVAQSLNDLVVLYRTNAQSRAVEETLIKAGVPYRLIGTVRFYDRKEVKDMLAYLRLIHNPQDQVSFGRAIAAPSRKVGPKTLAQYWANIGRADQIPAKVKPFLAAMSTWRELAESMPPAELIERVAVESGYEAFLRDGTTEGEVRWENVRELQSAAATHDELSTFLEQVALIQDTDALKERSTKPDSRGALTLMTIHAAKGLEYPVVFIIGMEESIFPHSRATVDATEMEEERRLCYVGMTRPKHRLYLVYAHSRRLFGDIVANPPSRFLEEIPEDLREELDW